jgi:hypothetical protein
MVDGCQLVLFSLGEYPRPQQSLIRRLRLVIDFMHLGSVSGLVYQLHRWLEEVHVSPEDGIDAIQRLQGCSRTIPVVAYQPSHYRPVLLLHMTTIVFLVRAGPGEVDSFSLAVGIEMMVDELTAVVRVHPQKREREILPYFVKSTANPLLPLSPYRHTF